MSLFTFWRRNSLLFGEESLYFLKKNLEKKMNNLQKPMARQNGLVVQEMPGEVLVYDLDSNKAHCLNESAATVWRSCDGTNSVADIVKHFEKTAGGTVTEDFVWLAIDQLNSNNLLESRIESRFAGQSRRDVLKKIGLASIVALPLIASLVAPQSALAGTSCLCTVPGNCVGQTGCASTVNCNAGTCKP